jgi:hypothetical protein
MLTPVAYTLGNKIDWLPGYPETVHSAPVALYMLDNVKTMYVIQTKAKEELTEWVHISTEKYDMLGSAVKDCNTFRDNHPNSLFRVKKIVMVEDVVEYK